MGNILKYFGKYLKLGILLSVISCPVEFSYGQAPPGYYERQRDSIAQVEREDSIARAERERMKNVYSIPEPETQYERPRGSGCAGRGLEDLDDGDGDVLRITIDCHRR
ncbi:hypothetical protein AUJ10_02870 [Candidatus Pacearchaeota archaeon CG1_02_31_27]|nr:MAG: hypothetical protein AUJ10_02870 [Candidatus Pacearchaeota archaeon CG1_02_31_27]PIN92084.1 MAG: hypothetical protein COU55_02770 [Candidatus Pacearchaeota archaeon CG10_big_fil_rev_8_21_14_0_10_31_59]PIU44050.1 MAG: hypothetical protein COS96_01085 [Candidatus Nealsonbacteria bacterium CG07_land_8_20_14_0_80_39_13]PIZ80299.1 MAG: hypothetical protein COX99_02875 [Candidatus Pacearchaeota archaeon CG_4_10_14_0_2_um_filter_31_10]